MRVYTYRELWHGREGDFLWDPPYERCVIKFPGGGIGYVSTGVHTWDENLEAPTFRPSIQLSSPRGEYDWHGWMTAGRLHREAPQE